MVPHLRTDVEGRSSSGLSHAALWYDFADIEISYFEAAILVFEDIGRFDIPMRDIMLVKVIDCLCNVEKDPPNSIL